MRSVGAGYIAYVICASNAHSSTIRSLHIAFIHFTTGQLKGGLNEVKGVGVNRENLEAIRRLEDFGKGRHNELKGSLECRYV